MDRYKIVFDLKTMTGKKTYLYHPAHLKKYPIGAIISVIVVMREARAV